MLIAAILACIAGLAGWASSSRRLSGGELAVFAGIPAAAGVLTRYEAWALVVSGSDLRRDRRAAPRRRRRAARSRSCCRSRPPPFVAIRWWLAYNTAWYGNPLEFLTGHYSAAAFTEVFVQQGQLTTKGNPGLSFEVLGWALLETAGLLPLVVAGIGLMVTTARWGLSDRALLDLAGRHVERVPALQPHHRAAHHGQRRLAADRRLQQPLRALGGAVGRPALRGPRRTRAGACSGRPARWRRGGGDRRRSSSARTSGGPATPASG